MINTFKQIGKILFLLTILTYSNDIVAQTTNTVYKKTTYSTTQTKKPTYKIYGTKYIYGETYKTTGQPKVERSSSAKQDFLKSQGYSKVEKGYQVDHKIPLSQGGQDVPSNMQLITIEQHKQKTAMERKSVSSSNSSKTYNYSTPKSSYNSYKSPSYNYSTPKSSYSSYKSPSYNYSIPKSSNSIKSYYGGSRRK